MIPWRWIAGAAVVGVLVGWYLRRPAVRVEERIVTQEVVRWQTKERIVTKPGAVVYLTRSADGTETTRIEGPVEIGRESEGSASRYEDVARRTESCPAPPSRILSGGIMMNLKADRWYGAELSANVIGPFWASGGAWVPSSLRWHETLVKGTVGIQF